MEIRDDRYSRLDIIGWWDQEILKKSRIMVVGCGALGNEIIKNLAMLGAGNIFAVDMDKVEKSNLTRSVLFRKEDEGKSKAETACKRAKEINDGINIKFFDGSIFELGLGVFKSMDIVICGLDNREARLFVNQSCWKVNTPWIDGAIEILNGVARMFIPPGGVDYESTMTEMDYRLINHRKSCMLLGIDDIEQGKIPTTPTIASVIAGIQVQEAVKYLHRTADMELLDGKGFVFNGMTNESYIVQYQVNEDCTSRYTFGEIRDSAIGFGEAKLSDVAAFGETYFGNENFTIEFNNEVVYELTLEEGGDKTRDKTGGKTKEFYANLNLLTVKDIKDGDNIYKTKIFHSLKLGSNLLDKLSVKTLRDLRVPYNDILILRSGTDETYIQFGYEEVFKET